MRYLILAGLLAIYSCKSTQRFEQKTIAIPYKCLCSEDRGDAMTAYLAVAREDREGVDGLIQRGKAIVLAKGVQVRTIGSMEGYTMIRVESGAQIGTRCWLPDQIVK